MADDGIPHENDKAATIRRLNDEIGRLQRDLAAIGSPPPPVAPARHGISDEMLREGVGEKRWPAFKRLWDEFNFSLRGARDGVELLDGAITREDFDRWMPKARKEVDVATARFSMIAEDLDKSQNALADAMRGQLSEMEVELSRLVAKGAPQTHSMKITGEYER